MMNGKGCKNLSLTTFSNILLHFEYNLNIDMFRLKNLNILGSKAELAALPEGKLLINTINAHSYNTARKDELFAEALTNGDVLIPDGVSIVKACRWIKAKSQPKERIAGWDLFSFEMENLERKQCGMLRSARRDACPSKNDECGVSGEECGMNNSSLDNSQSASADHSTFNIQHSTLTIHHPFPCWSYFYLESVTYNLPLILVGDYHGSLQRIQTMQGY